MAKFYIAKGYENHGVELPVYGTALAAGCDMFSAEDVTIPPYLGENGLNKPTLIPLGVKCELADDEYLAVVSRSSGPTKLGIMCTNNYGVIDADYFGNTDNDGAIFFQVVNLKQTSITIPKGTRVCQGIVQKFCKAEGTTETGAERVGGFGSTGA